MGEAAFMRKLRRAFAVEARERLSAMEAALMSLEGAVDGLDAPDAAAAVETFYRDVHSLKGASRTVDARALETICQPLESALDMLKAGRIKPSVRLHDLLHTTLNTLKGLLVRFDPEVDGGSLPSPDDLGLQQLAAALTAVAQGQDVPATPGLRVAPAQASDSNREAARQPRTQEMLRLPPERLERLMHGCEDFLPEKQALTELAEEARHLQDGLSLLRRHMTRLASLTSPVSPASAQSPAPGPPLGAASGAAPGVAPSAVWTPQPVDTGPGLLLDQATTLALDLDARLKAHAGRLSVRQRALAGKVDSLLGDLRQALILPFSRLFERFPKMVRDLARELGKAVDLELLGEDMEVDRRILDLLHDPLLHLLRNAVDHGLEPPHERRGAGKPERGRISVRVLPMEREYMKVVVTDDGRGIDHEEVLRSARAAGLLGQAQTGAQTGAQGAGLREEAALELVFRSGMSTRQAVTGISGRGLGLAIVREHVERLGGSLRLETRPGQGTSFYLLLPLSLSSFPALAVQAAGQTFLLAKSRIERVLLLDPDDIRLLEGRQSVMFQGESLGLADLAELLELPVAQESAGNSDDRGRTVHAVVISSSRQRLALRVDALLGEQEITVKLLGSQLKRVRNVAGVTVLGSGRLAPILHVPDLVASGLDRRGSRPVSPPAHDAQPNSRNVLVVEDSVTSRMLLKGMLESAGYVVTTAVDGADALVKMNEARPDLVVTDVQMPRMDGLELTRRIREDETLAALPVVLVTSLGSQTDRERGVDAGANAYIIKSSFDQGNLLDTVRRLI